MPPAGHKITQQITSLTCLSTHAQNINTCKWQKIYACKVAVNRTNFFLLSLISAPFLLHDLPLHFHATILCHARSPLQAYAVTRKTQSDYK